MKKAEVKALGSETVFTFLQLHIINSQFFCVCERLR